MTRAALLALLTLTSCASANARPEDEVDVPPPPSADVAPPATEKPEPPPAEHDEGDLAACASNLRRAAGIVDAARADYDAALRAELGGEVQEARKGYFRIVDQHRGSPLVPFAYFAFGALFDVDAEADPSKLPFSEQAYREAMKYPGSPVGPLSQLRLANNLRAQGKREEELATLASVLRATPDAPPSSCAPEVASAARRAIVAAYADTGQPAKAYAFFHRLVGQGTAAVMVARLADHYVDRGDRAAAERTVAAALEASIEPPAELCAVARALVPSPKGC